MKAIALFLIFTFLFVGLAAYIIGHVMLSKGHDEILLDNLDNVIETHKLIERKEIYVSKSNYEKLKFLFKNGSYRGFKLYISQLADDDQFFVGKILM